MTTTDRLGMPLIEPGQAQKELFHNEALVHADIAVQASVEEAGRNVPPADPVAGACWIVGPAPTGPWAGQAGALAGWTPGGWRFVPAREGMTAWDVAGGVMLRYVGSMWRRGAAVTEPSGGATVDAECRAALATLVATMRLHGLVGS